MLVTKICKYVCRGYVSIIQDVNTIKNVQVMYFSGSVPNLIDT